MFFSNVLADKKVEFGIGRFHNLNEFISEVPSLRQKSSYTMSTTPPLSLE